MAQYPQGVTDYIPDYQASQPDLNLLANVLQLKQTQYDQNWSRLNSMYGQLLNAPLTHSESIKKRDNTFKRIDFDLKRITGLDLSLDQNVQQATQLFRPFYEDSSLMKDMAFTKNATFERSLGEGKRYSTDEDIYSGYWGDGIRAIDYRIEEFKNTPYEQLTSFGDVKYTPYVNVEKMAREMAEKMKYKVKTTTPQGDWLVTEQNGEQIIAPLKSVFYAELGNDPRVKEFYSTLAYLKRKDAVASDKDLPKYGGNAMAAERDYINENLKVLKNQTVQNRDGLLNQKKVNDKMIEKMEKSIEDGTDIETTESSLERYRQANDQIAKLLEQSEQDLKLLDGDLNKTLNSQGGSDLSKADLTELRGRVDAVKAGVLLQEDLDNAANDFAYMNYEKTYDANPFAVQRQKFQYDSSLISQRADAQKDVAYYKYLLDLDKIGIKAKLDSGLYRTDENGNLVMKEEFADIQAVADMMAKTKQTDPTKLASAVNKMFEKDAAAASTTITALLDEFEKEGVLSKEDMAYIFGDKSIKGKSKPLEEEWFGKGMAEILMKDPKTAKSFKAMNAQMQEDERKKIQTKLKKGDFSSLEPEQIISLTQRMNDIIAKKKDNPNVRNSKVVAKMISLGHDLQDYSGYLKAYKQDKKMHAEEVIANMKADGFQYAEYLFDENYNPRSKEDFKAKVAMEHPDEVSTQDGMSWGGFANAVLGAGSVGAGLGLAGGPFAEITVPAGGLVGMASGAIGYLGSGVLEWGYNSLFGDSDDVELDRASYSWTGHHRNVAEEYEAMQDNYESMVEDSRLKSPLAVLNNPVGQQPLDLYGQFKNSAVGQFLGFEKQGTGLYTANGAGITVQPGLFSPTYQHYLEVAKTLRNLDTGKDDGSTYISFQGVNTPFGEIKGDPADNNEIWNGIWADLKQRTNKKNDVLKSFQVVTSPIAGDDMGKAAIQFRLPEEYLKRFKQDDKGVGLLDKDNYNLVLKNGITIITDANNLLNLTMFKNSFKSRELINIERAGSEGVTYTDPRLPGYSVNYKMGTGNNIVVEQAFASYDPNKGKVVFDKDIDNLSNMGVNLRAHREAYFNNFAMQNQISVNQTRRQYGRK